jgi:hypothetical protein
VSVVKYGLPVPAARMTTRPFSADVGLGHLVHPDRAHDARRHPGTLERVLEGEGVHDGRKHPDVVTGGTVHPARRGSETPEDVAAAHDDPHLHPEARHVGDLRGDEGAELGVDAVLARPEESLPGELEEDPSVAELALRSVGGGGPAFAHSSSPSA